jgi:hypothetical protein
VEGQVRDRLRGQGRRSRRPDLPRQARYAAATQALARCAAPADDARERAWTAVWQAKDAEITAEIGHDGLKDSWWDAHFSWVAGFFEIVAVAVLVLAVVAIILACPFSAVLLGAAAVETASTAIGWPLFGLTIAQAAFDGTAMATHKESWTAFAWDIAALATFGTGKAAEAGVKWLAENSADVGQTIASRRAGVSTLWSKNLPGILFSLATRSRVASGAMRVLGMGGALDAATKAAAGARAAVITAAREATRARRPVSRP